MCLSATVGITMLFVGFVLGTIFGGSLVALRRTWVRPLSPAAQAALQRHGRFSRLGDTNGPARESIARPLAERHPPSPRTDESSVA